MEWIIFSVLAAAIWGLVNISDKYVLNKWVKHPEVPLIALGFISIVTAIVIYFVNGLASLSLMHTGLVFLAGISYVLGSMFYFQGVKLGEISRVAPLFNLIPLFVVILAAIFLGEVFSSLKYLGILLLVCGAIVVSTNKLLKIRFNKAFWLIMLSNLGFAIDFVITKYLLNFADYWSVFAYIRLSTFIAMIPIIIKYYPSLVFSIKQFGKRTFALMSLNETLNLVAVLLLTIAMVSGFVSLVDSLTALQPFFVLVFAVIASLFFPKILKEEIDKRNIVLKLLAIVIMFVGVALIV